MIAAWRQASVALSFRLEAPYQVELASKDQIWVEGYLPDFGSASGMIFTTLDRGAIPTKLYRSRISQTYRTYDRETFIEALQDWGWFGAVSLRPIWLA